jgi:hypothetical protein
MASTEPPPLTDAQREIMEKAAETVEVPQSVHEVSHHTRDH